ncbi:MAG: Fur family transcriptional regulator [Armatimonadota bacterium]
MQSSEEKRFREFLETQALRFTTERRLILKQVARIHEHFEAEDVVDGLRRRGDRVSRASIYRTLPLLVESGLLREVHSSEKHSHYEHIFGHDHHDHLICTVCGRAIEFSDGKIEELQERVCRMNGFDAVSHKLEIIGVCAGCKGA